MIKMVKGKGVWLWSLVVVFLLVGVLWFSGLFGQGSIVLSPPTSVSLSDGRVFWVMTNVGTDLSGSSYSFRFLKGSNLLVGEGLEPKKSQTIMAMGVENSCEYQMVLTSKPVLFGLKKYEYYLVSNPERIAKIRFSDSYGHVKVVDATESQSFSLVDGDGKGEVVISTYGQTVGKSDCPESSNVAVIFDADGVNYFFVDKSDLENKISQYAGLGGLGDFLNKIFGNDKVRSNTLFTSSFDGTVGVSSDRSGVLGVKKTGEVFWTLSADADYFDAVPVYTPGLVGDPSVSVSAVDTLKGGTSSVKVTVKNKGNFKADALLSMSVSQGSISPSSRSVSINPNGASYTFTWNVGTSVTSSAKVTVLACSSSQFDGSNCDSASDSIRVTETKPSVFCGDGVCQSNEDSNTCQVDCPFVVPPVVVNDTCDDLAWGLIPGVSAEVVSGCGVFDFACKWGWTEPEVTKKCVYDYTLVIILGVVLFLGLFLLLFFGKSKRGKRGLSKSQKTVAVVFGILLVLGALVWLFVTYWIWFVVAGVLGLIGYIGYKKVM